MMCCSELHYTTFLFQGGFFIWLQLPVGVDAEPIADLAYTTYNLKMLCGKRYVHNIDWMHIFGDNALCRIQNNLQLDKNDSLLDGLHF